MSEIICANCGAITNTAVCNWYPFRPDKKAHYCYAVFVDGKWGKGCAYDKADIYTKPGVDKLLIKKYPSDFFTCYPWNSVMKNAECEIVAFNIMKILGRNENMFRPLSYDEYKKERLKDGRYTDSEIVLFEKVINYFESAETASTFCDKWKKIFEGSK